MRNPTIGYCQGFNFIVGRLIKVVNEEVRIIIFRSEFLIDRFIFIGGFLDVLLNNRDDYATWLLFQYGWCTHWLEGFQWNFRREISGLIRSSPLVRVWPIINHILMVRLLFLLQCAFWSKTFMIIYWFIVISEIVGFVFLKGLQNIL